MKNHGGSGVLSASRGAENTDAADIQVWIFSSGCLDPGDAVGQSGVREIVPANSMKRLGAEGGAHGITLDEDKTGIGQAAGAVAGAERFRHIGALRTVIDAFENGILFGGIEIFWTTDNSPNVGLSVAPFGDEHFRRLPTALLEFGNIGFFQLTNQLAITGAAQFMDWRHVRAAVSIHNEFAVRRKLNAMISVGFGEGDQT